MKEEKYNELVRTAVEGDPGLAKFASVSSKESKYGAMSPSQVAGQ
jgi:hypothetical protein